MDIMNINNDSFIVMRAKRNTCNVNKLLGSNIVGDVASVESDNYAIILGHMCVSHLSEHGMMEPHKRNLFKGILSRKIDLFKFVNLRNNVVFGLRQN